jgi:NAD(P)-dependent dehydrogenase (short-subunit alcohol dehydrogenase family)
MSEEVVIISGVGARGQLGYALAERFLAAGARVIVTGRSAAVLQLADELAGRGQIVGVTADLTHDEDAERVVAAATERWGRVDALINAAGGLTLIRAAAETSLAELEREVERNAGTLLVLTRAALPALRRSRGAVVNFASPAAAQPPASLGAYAAGKASVVALTRALAVEEKAHGVRVNAIAPGTMDTDQNRASMPDARYVKREDVAELAFFLASRAAAAISGEVITARFETSA